MLFWLIGILLGGGIFAWLSERRGDRWPRRIAVISLSLGLLMSLSLLSITPSGSHLLSSQGVWIAALNWQWIPRFGISFRLGMDGLSLVLIILTFVLGLAAVSASWKEIKQRSGFFYFSLLWTLAGVVGVFLALDLFLFFFFWEVMLVPMYFLISIWGHERRVYASIKFFIFTQGSSLLMLIAMLALVFVHYRNSGILTFNYFDLLHTGMSPATGYWLMLGFFIAFSVKLPAVPLHTWLPDAHTEASTGGSVILAGLLLKTGAYGLLRFVVPLFPDAAHAFAPLAMTLGVIGILYGAVLAFAQTDFKRLVAYSSVSHMGFILLGVFAWNALALQGAVLQMIAHGISTSALFMLAGMLQERLQTRDMRQMGGLWAITPRMGAMILFFAVASLGLPGLGNFVGEFLVLLGTFPVSITATAVATIGIVTAVVYSLILVQRTLFGEARAGLKLGDLAPRETFSMAIMVVGITWLGIYPQPVIDTLAPALASLEYAGENHPHLANARP